MAKLDLYLDAAGAFWQRVGGRLRSAPSGHARRRLAIQRRLSRLPLGVARVAFRRRGDRRLRALGEREAVLARPRFRAGAAAHGSRDRGPFACCRTRLRVARVRRGEASAQDATLLYRRMLRLARRRGYQKPPWFTPAEFASSLPPDAFGGAIGEFTAAYNALRFGQRSEGPRLTDTAGRDGADQAMSAMKAAILHHPAPIANRPLEIGDAPDAFNSSLARCSSACAPAASAAPICTSSKASLPPQRSPLIPGHQIVGEVVDGATPELPLGTRVGVSWLGGVDGTCPYCARQMENLCDAPTFTGYSVNGGYAEFAAARADFVFPLPDGLDDLHAAPLLCAGIIGFRSLRVAGVAEGERVGLFGFGASGAPRHRRAALVELRGLRFHPRRIAPRTRALARRNMGRR